MQTTQGVADVNVSRDANYPQFELAVDREKAAVLGLSQRDVAQAALFSLNSKPLTLSRRRTSVRGGVRPLL